MKISLSVLLSFAILSLICVNFVNCYWCLPHEIISRSALELLRRQYISTSTQASNEALLTLLDRLNAVIPDYNNNLVQSACWPDDLKGQQSNSFNHYHFADVLLFKEHIDQNPYAKDFNLDAAARATVEDKNTVTFALQTFVETILSNKQSPTTLVDFSKSFALRWAIHLVGDIHQPLHTTSLSDPVYWPKMAHYTDIGGNFFRIKPIPQEGGSDISQLHALWDSGVLLWAKDCPKYQTASGDSNIFTPNFSFEKEKSINPCFIGHVEKNLERITQLFPNNKFDCSSDVLAFNATKWLLEGHDAADGYAYSGITYQGEASADYIAKGQDVSRNRVALASARLACILKDVVCPAANCPRLTSNGPKSDPLFNQAVIALIILSCVVGSGAVTLLFFLFVACIVVVCIGSLACLIVVGSISGARMRRYRKLHENSMRDVPQENGFGEYSL